MADPFAGVPTVEIDETHWCDTHLLAARLAGIDIITATLRLSSAARSVEVVAQHITASPSQEDAILRAYAPLCCLVASDALLVLLTC